MPGRMRLTIVCQNIDESVFRNSVGSPAFRRQELRHFQSAADFGNFPWGTPFRLKAGLHTWCCEPSKLSQARSKPIANTAQNCNQKYLHAFQIVLLLHVK